jgi:hypothetical protein
MLAYQSGGWQAFKFHDDCFMAGDAVTAGHGKKYFYLTMGCPWTRLHAWAAPQVGDRQKTIFLRANRPGQNQGVFLNV